MNIDYDDVEMQFKVKVSFTVKVKKPVHKNNGLQDVEEELINKIYDEPEAYMDDLEVTDVERLL